MIGGALNFTLGLGVTQFANSLGIAGGKLVGFLGVANGVQAAFGKMWDAVQQGGKLTDLAAAASISVKELYQLQFAFEQVGASADSVGSVIQRMRANLAGGSQDNLLQQLGLDPATLRSADVAAQFENIAAAMGKLDATSRAGAAQKLFGREGAQVAQIIANSGNDFADAMKRAESDAEVWQRVAHTFDGIADKVVEIGAHIKTVWAQFTGAAIQAFQDGSLAEIITQTIVTGFQAAMDIIPGILFKLGEVLLRAFATPLEYFQAGLDYVVQNFMASFHPALKKLFGLEGFEPVSFEQALAERREDGGLKFNFGAGEFGVTDVSEFANSLMTSGMEAARERFAALGAVFDDLIKKLPQGTTVANGVEAAGGKAQKSLKSDFTDIEKMGGVLLGLGRGFGGDDARQTANNTKLMVAEQKATNAILKENKLADFSNF